MPRKAAKPPETEAVSRFESAMRELESIVAQMEGGELPLQQSLALFERGVGLARECRHSLAAAELRVKTLLEAVDHATPDPNDDDSADRPSADPSHE